jgi:hypothetical protein
MNLAACRKWYRNKVVSSSNLGMPANAKEAKDALIDLF